MINITLALLSIRCPIIENYQKETGRILMVSLEENELKLRIARLLKSISLYPV
ncbi:MAG: hypothetical protein K9W42_13215 [Candidatus Heimdallarchaeota archaeon]|nr:hypothetical protein [Candidatus Heimdallarchaeota archaeon]